MKARIKRLFILILVCALVINSDMAYATMGINMISVHAAENDGTDDQIDDTTDSGEDTSDGVDDTPDSGEDTSDGGDDTPDSGEDTPDGGDDTPDSGEDTSDGVEDTPDSGEDTSDDGDDTTMPATPLTIDEMLAILDTVPAEATLENQLAFLGANMAGVTVDGMTMAQVLSLINVDATGMDLSAVTVDGIRSGDYSLADILSMVQMRANDGIETLAGTSIIPTTADGLAGMGTTFTLSTYQDLVNLQKLSQTTSLEGYTFTFLKILDENDQTKWNFYKANVDGNGYIGIGNETCPFKGTLNMYLNGVVLNVNKPVCNYVSTGASFDGLQFNVSGGASATIAQYLVTEEGSSSQTVTLKNLGVSGAIGTNTTAVAGGLFAYVENDTTSPIVLELGENSSDSTYSVKMKATVNGVYAGGIIGTVNSQATSIGPVQITNKISTVAGTVTGGGTGAAGGIVGKLGQNATFTMDTATFKATVGGNGNNGGVVGIVEKGNFVNTTATTVTTSVKSNNTLAAGGLIGKTIDANSIQIENVTISGANVEASGAIAGGIIGQYSDSETVARTETSTFKNIIVNATTIAGYDKGGVIGKLEADNLLIDSVTVNNKTIIGATGNGLAGGLVGRMTGRNIELKNSNVAAAQLCGAFRGGLVGSVEATATDDAAVRYDSQVRITNATVTTNFSTTNASGVAGGLIGRVQKAALVCLDGDLAVQTSSLGSAVNKGYIVGESTAALVYFEDNTVRETFETSKTEIANIYDNVGSYGGVIENCNGLIDYNAAPSKNVTRIIAGDGTEGNPYVITCKEDLMRLAIALNTDCAYAADCFGVSATRDGAKQLRSAHYTVTNSIDLTNTGIYDLSRNDRATEAYMTEYAFKGTFAGSNENIAITMDSHATNQSYIGLFPSVSNATFKNLTIKTAHNSPWKYAKHAAGIVPFVYGGINLDTVTSEVHLVARQETAEYYYGAITGRMLLNSTYGATVTTNDIAMKATIENIRARQYTGGLAGGINSVDGNAGATIALNGTTTVGNNFTYSGDYRVSNVKYTSYSGGLIGEIYTGNYQNKTFLTMTAEDVVVDNQILDYSGATNLVNDSALSYNEVGAGGLLGHHWDNVEADFTKITVTGDDTKLIAPSTKARYGGLFGRVSGKLYLHDVDLLSGTFSNSISGSGLLVSNGRFLVCMVDDYTIDANKVKVTNITGYFDELVGHNVYAYGVAGGVLSIKSDSFRDMSSAGYVNQLLPASQTNDYSRYYFNLFEQSADEYTLGMIENNVLDTPAKVMIWHLNQYVTNELERFVKGYFGTGSNSGEGNISRTFKQTLDMKGYSYYPTPYYYGGVLSGTDNAEIIFYGDKIAEIEAGNRAATTSNQQQYRMHAGLLFNPSGSTIQDITFSGSITNLAGTTGAIAVGSSNSLTVKDVTLDGLHVTDYNGTQHAVGLIISIVNDNSTVNLSGIKMTGYNDTVWGAGAGQNKYAASALIGRVGYNHTSNTSLQSKNIKIYFSDMEIPYVKVKENAANAPVQTEAALRYATFIDIYEYTSNMDEYKGQGLYLFTQEEYDAKTVTLGKEIHYGLMYDDKMVSLPTAVLTEAEANYLPYVCDNCSQTTIQVNPKRGDLLEGCGTYEDPYVLNNAKQIYQLYQYLSPKSVGNDTYLSGWRVNQLGVHDTHVEITYGADDFPTRDELRTAYYVVKADIDLTSISDVNDYVISNDFDGIGSSSYPFAGVIYGADATNKYTITLPGHDKGKAKTNYGFINVMKGAVVKDLNIATAATSDSTQKDDIYIKSVVGSVAAKIIGGDNIIDNVTISTKLTANSTGTIMGGYVGVIEKGGLIVRNLEANDLTGFTPLVLQNSVAIANDSEHVSALVGKVKDGYLLYEGNVNGTANVTKKVLVAADFGLGADSLELSKTFQMVNGSYLDSKATTDKIQVTVDDTAKTTNIVLANDAHLEIIALALNSEGLSSYSIENTTNYNGYDERAICRKADYDSMGTASTTDGTFAETYDDETYNFPYLIYKYFEINGGESTVNYDKLYTNVSVTVNNQAKTAVVSKLNKLTGATDYTSYYKLTTGTYDMTDYKYAFRGLGELYDTTAGTTTDVRYSRFNANFDGGNSTIIANMNVDYDTTRYTTGLFNDLNSFAYCKDYTLDTSETHTIENLIVEGKFSNTDTDGTTSRKVGAIAGSVYGNWTFSNITLQNAELEGDDAVGGLVGRILSDTTTITTKLAYKFDNCKVSGVKDASGNIIDPVTINSVSGGAGGFVGVVSSSVQGTYWYGGLVECTNSQIDGLKVYSTGGSVGGFIGLSGNMVNSQINVDNNNFTNMTLVATTTAGSSVGGFIGTYIPVPWHTTERTESHTLTVTNNIVSDSTMTSLANFTTDHVHGIGGLVGLIGLKESIDRNSTFTFEENTVKDVTLGQWVDESGNTTIAEHPVGGLVGITYGNQLIITDCTVKNTVEPSNAGAAIFTTRGTDIGGLVGRMMTRTCVINYTEEETLTEEGALTSSIEADIENLKIVGVKGPEANSETNRGTRVGGLLGCTAGNNTSLSIANVKVDGCSMDTSATYLNENTARCGAGGLVGIISSLNYANNTQPEIQFNNILVANSDISGFASGGLVGVNRVAIAEGYNIEAQNIAVRKSNLLGQSAGGIFGIDLATGKDRTNSYKNIIVDSNRIGAAQSSSNTYNYIWAGGFSGKVNSSGFANANGSAKQYYNDVVISNNYIVGYSSALENARIGGMFGLLSTGTTGKDFYIYKPIIQNNYIGIWKNEGSDLALCTMENLKDISTNKVGLLKFDATTKKYSVVDSLPATLEEKDIQYYSTNVGNIAGKMLTGFRVIVLRPEITFDSSAIRPVVDCGVAVTSINSGTYVDGNYSITDSSQPYAYRTYFNVIYFEPKATVSTAANTVMSAFSSTYGETEYLFDSIEDIQSEYKAVDNVVADSETLLDAYRLNLYYTTSGGTNLTLMDVYDKAYYNGSNDATVISEKGVTDDLVGIPLIVYDAQNGTASQLVYSFLKMLTNGGDTLNSDISGITKITAKKAMVKDGAITSVSSTGSSLTVSGRNINYNHYDTYDATNGTSITLLEISYGWTTALGEEVRETIYLPVYVLERLDVRTFIRMDEGAVYSYDEMKNSTIGDGTTTDEVVIANDTTYTMAIEFLYGSGRAKFANETVNKVIKMTENTSTGTETRTFAVGTKLTLIDVETGFAYYYEITEAVKNSFDLGLKNSISFDEFTRIPSDDTTAYTIRTMAEVDAINSDALQASYTSLDTGNKVYTNVGVERYLLIVDGSDAVEENAVYDVTVATDSTQNNSSKDIYPAGNIEVTSIPGLQVGFVDKGVRTTITGQMMRSQDVVINAVYGIKAPKLENQSEDAEAPYWLMASSSHVIDSTNNGKYLELAIYLQDKKGNRITLPQNTNISMNGQMLTASGSQSVFYFYKDTSDTESLDGLTSDKEWETEIVMNFDTALLDTYNDEYSVVIELLRTNDPSYPMSGDKPDYYGDEITAHIQTDLAIAVLADDLITLGINTYMETTHDYEIPFTSMIDFGSVIEFDLENGEDVINAQLVKWCDETEYQITYRLYRKVETAQGKEYIPIDDSRISLWRVDENAEGGYSPFETATDANGQTVYREIRNFTQDEVRTGTDGAQGLITNKLLLQVNTEGISDVELSNYKLEMSVIAYDSEPTQNADGSTSPAAPTGDEAVLQDFFIFTIAELKTDME